MADSFLPRRQESKGSALARSMMGRNSQTGQVGGVTQQVMVAGFNDEVLGSIDRNLKSILQILTKDLELQEDNLQDDKNAALQAKSQERKSAEGKSIASPIMGGIKKIGDVAKKVTNVKGMLEGIIEGFLSIMMGFIAGKLPEIIEGIKATWDTVSKAVMDVVNSIVEGIKEAFNFVKDIVVGIIDFFKGGFDFLGKGIKGFVDFIVGVGEKIFEGLKTAWNFVTNLPGMIGGIFKKGWNWITGGDKTEGEYKGEPIKNARGRTIGYKKPEGSAEIQSSEKTYNENFSDKVFDKKSEVDVNLNNSSSSDEVGDMKGQGNKKNPVIQPKVLTGLQKEFYKQEQMNNAVPVTRSGAAIVEPYKTELSQVEPSKVKNNKTVAQQKPESTPLVIPLATPTTMTTTKSQTTSLSRPRGGGNNSKSIPSKNPKNFYPMFAAIQYNCMADF